jgi:hypothetical protein
MAKPGPIMAGADILVMAAMLAAVALQFVIWEVGHFPLPIGYFAFAVLNGGRAGLEAHGGQLPPFALLGAATLVQVLAPVFTCGRLRLVLGLIASVMLLSVLGRRAASGDAGMVLLSGLPFGGLVLAYLWALLKNARAA